MLYQLLVARAIFNLFKIDKSYWGREVDFWNNAF